MDEKAVTETIEDDIGVTTLQPLNFHLVEADKTIVTLPAEMADGTTLSRNTRFLNSNYMGEIAQFVHPWKKETVLSLEAESKSDKGESTDSKADGKSESKVSESIEIPDTLVYVEVVPELSAKAKRKLAISKLSDEKPGTSGSDSDSDDKSTSSILRKSRRDDSERKSIRFSLDYDDDDRRRYTDRDDNHYDSDSKSDRHRSDNKDKSYK